MSDPGRFGHFEVRVAERRVLVDGHPAALGARAFDLRLPCLHTASPERAARQQTLHEVVR